MTGPDPPGPPPQSRGVPLLSPEEWRRLEPLVDAVLDAAPSRRSTLLAELSGGDASRRAELAGIVAECERAYPLLDRPAAERFASVFGDDAPPMPETLAGRYRIVREAGRGGMAIVYLARDLKHGRDVAIKVVRPELAAAIGRERFLREIEIAARLRHPLIVPLYDSGELSADDEPGGTGASLLYYVMPYEAGQSLRARLEHDGPLPVADVVLVLRDLCDALAHAQRHGIVHRDIKPDNVLLSGGHALVTDFGVARAVTEAATEATAVVGSDSTMLGTPTYMAPEQRVRGARVDHRADIYAVGVMAFELLAGRPPFSLDERSRTSPPPTRGASDEAATRLSSLRPDVPEGLAAAIGKCLAERPADRWQGAAELLARLDSITAASASTAAPGARKRDARALTLVGGAVVAASLVAAAAIGLSRTRHERAVLAIGRAAQLTSDPGLEVQPSMSPDGRRVAYAAGHVPHMRIFVRPVAGGRAVPLTSDSIASQWFPRWSPDGRRVLFLARGGAFSAPAVGGASAREEVPDRPGVVVTSATWSPDGREIAYVRGDSLLARAAGTGRDRVVTTGPDLHSCTWSPSGVRLACVSGNSFYVTVGAMRGAGPMFGNFAPSRIVVVPAAGGRAVSVTDSGSLHQSPVWSRDGRTLYYVSSEQGPRDVYALDVSDGAPPDRRPVRVTTGMGVQSIDLSSDGTRVVYAVYASSANVWAVPIPRARRSGSAAAAAAAAVQITSGNQTVEGIRVSPDGRWLVYDSDLSGNSDVYRVPVAGGGGEPERLTRGPMDEFRGALSPDGKELVFHTFQTGARNVFLAPIGGGSSGAVRQLTRPPGQGSMVNWAPDGTAIAFFNMATTEVLVMRRDRRGRWGAPRFVGGRGWRPEWSPDGRSIAFVSPADGRIGVVPSDSGAPRDLYVPAAGGPPAELAIFSADGREIYFKSHDARGRASFWSMPATGGGDGVAGGTPRLLLRFDDLARASNRFDFASDGRRFYFTVEDRQSDIWVADVAQR